MKQRLTASFKSTYPVMYAVALVVWQNFLTYLSFFTAYNAAYTAGTAEAAIEAIEEARSLPDENTRRAKTKSLRQLLRKGGKQCCNNFLMLMSYLEKAFPPSQAQAMKQAAGYASYKKASQGNLIALAALNMAAVAFVNGHGDELSAAGMPDAFAQSFTDEVSVFSKTYTEYTAAVQAGQEDTNAKTAANNAVFATMMNLLRDAKMIFMNDATRRAFFTYETIAVRFRKEGRTGLRFEVRVGGTNAPGDATKFVFMPGNLTAATNKKGIAKIELQKEVIYSYTATTPHFDTVSAGKVQATPGVMGRVKITLTATAAQGAL